ncbi:MAG TPA: hypothetical protein VLU54_10975 [Casimicrobiaceae bacterium]|nr:hypothetical protein [Casimicrobiaceae bacterium]
MRRGFRGAVLLVAGLLAVVAGRAQAAPVTFNFQYAVGGATATGHVTFESTLLPNPGVLNVPLPNPAVLDLQVTVSGATAGNGTYGLGSFTGIVFDTGGATLDFSTQLVGQPTLTSNWGTPNGGPGGDFNLFGAAPAPRGVYFFTLGANGGAADPMVLVSMTQAGGATPVPALDGRGLVLLAVLLGGVGLAALPRSRRRI